jgi:hypothetical protein
MADGPGVAADDRHPARSTEPWLIGFGVPGDKRVG